MPATDERVICRECEAEGEKSCVVLVATTMTLMGSLPYYDEDGRLHEDDPNTYTTAYTCSRGHQWSVSRRASDAAGREFVAGAELKLTDEQLCQALYRYQIGSSGYWVECRVAQVTVVYPDGHEEAQNGIIISDENGNGRGRWGEGDG